LLYWPHPPKPTLLQQSKRLTNHHSEEHCSIQFGSNSKQVTHWIDYSKPWQIWKTDMLLNKRKMMPETTNTKMPAQWYLMLLFLGHQSLRLRFGWIKQKEDWTWSQIRRIIIPIKRYLRILGCLKEGWSQGIRKRFGWTRCLKRRRECRLRRESLRTLRSYSHHCWSKKTLRWKHRTRIIHLKG
jgi:hypothetical protein